MPLRIRPTVDFAFKLLFGSPEHARVTIHFLNAVLRPRVRITHITIQNPFQGKDSEFDKLAVLDIRAVDELGRIYNVEMQTTLPAGLSQRLTYYTACLHCAETSEGDLYTSLRPAISICVFTRPMFPGEPNLHLEFQLRTETGLLLDDQLQIHPLQLSNLGIEEEDVPRARPLEQWAYLMLNSDRMTLDDVRRIFPDVEFSEAAGGLEMISNTPEQQMIYDARLKFQTDEATRLELAREEGFREGEARGEKLGQVMLLQQLLGAADPSPSNLSKYDFSQLTELINDLQRRLRLRGIDPS